MVWPIVYGRYSPASSHGNVHQAPAMPDRLSVPCAHYVPPICVLCTAFLRASSPTHAPFTKLTPSLPWLPKLNCFKFCKTICVILIRNAFVLWDTFEYIVHN